jgi:hypothetical protein
VVLDKSRDDFDFTALDESNCLPLVFMLRRNEAPLQQTLFTKSVTSRQPKESTATGAPPFCSGTCA